jgi:hypothetical protein
MKAYSKDYLVVANQFYHNIYELKIFSTGTKEVNTKPLYTTDLCINTLQHAFLLQHVNVNVNDSN